MRGAAAARMLRCGSYTRRMKRLWRDLGGPCVAPTGSVACVGAFDGVHRGHQALLAGVRARAAERGLLPLAITFEPVPREFFARGRPVARLTSPREKWPRLWAAGAEGVLSLRFGAKLAALEAEDFIRRVLVARAGVRVLRVGADFRFGHGRRGDVAMLREAGAQLGFTVEVQEEVTEAGERISSSALRAALAAGEFERAARLLGRPFAIGGHVARGRQLGRTLGYPTANLPLGRRAAPVSGIFAVRVHGVSTAAEPAGWPGVASLGTRPAVAGEDLLLEAHLFDFAGDLYGRRIEVEFLAKLRDEAYFPDLASLQAQMNCDAAAARAALGLPPAPAPQPPPALA